MTYKFADRADNVFCIDAGMFGFDRYMSVFLVQGEKLALIDTGLPDSLQRVRAGIKAHGFSVADLDYIFITHEHHDHSGNLGPLLRENPNIKAYISQIGADWVADPSQEADDRKEKLGAKMAKRFASMEPVPVEKLNIFVDGDEFDLGGGESLKVFTTGGHQPGGAVILEQKHKGLFINDIVGNCFADCDFQLILNPPLSNMVAAQEFLKRVRQWDLERLFLGHYGISEQPLKIIDGAIRQMQELLDIGAAGYATGDRELMVQRFFDYKLKEVEKLRARGQALYDYMSGELVAAQAKLCTDEFCRYMEQKA